MNNIETLLFSIILAFRNEASYLEKCLGSFDNQTLSRGKWEIILVDGGSSDGSKEVAEAYVRNHNNAKILENTLLIATAGWNTGLKAASGKYCYIASAHSTTEKNYLSYAESILLSNGEIDALGGRIFKIGDGIVSNSISEATNQSFAMGGSYYRIGTKAKKTNVIGCGIYSSNLFDTVGLFDENIKRSGDWEFNHRVNANGHLMYFDPRLIVYVYTRANFKSLFIQQFRTGFWKIRVWLKHRKAILPRHFIPALFVIWLLLIPFISSISKTAQLIAVVPLLLYILAAIYSTVKVPKDKTKWYYVLLTFPILHIAYGLGFITGIFRWGWYLLTKKNKK
jgi:glycosyltransferase involved in cell wall biosynthesis